MRFSALAGRNFYSLLKWQSGSGAPSFVYIHKINFVYEINRSSSSVWACSLPVEMR